VTGLADYTTLGLGGPAKNFAAAATETDLIDAVRAADAGGEPVLLHALLRGEPLDSERHQPRAAVRGVSSEGVLVERDGDDWRARARLEVGVV